MTKRHLFLGAGIALGLGIAARFLTALTAPAAATPPVRSPDAPLSETPAHTMTPGDNRFRWRETWTVAVPNLQDISLSAVGFGLHWVDESGCVRRIYPQTGRTLWQTAPLPGVNRIVAAPDGSAAAFSSLNPENRVITILDARDGDRNARSFAVSGAVWSAAFDSEDGVWLGSGDRTVYDTKQSAKIPRFQSVGVPDSLSIASGAPRLALGTWQPAAVIGCSLATTAPCWRKPEAPADTRCRVQVSADGSRVMVVATRGPAETNAVVMLLDGQSGDVLWATSFPKNASRPTAILSEDGKYLAVSYLLTKDDAHSDTPEAKLVLFDADGKRCFRDKGSALFRPRVVGIAADGSMLTVQSGPDTLFTLDRRGNFISKLRLAADPKTGDIPTIRRTLSSLDGRTLLLYRSDDRLTLLRAS